MRKCLKKFSRIFECGAVRRTLARIAFLGFQIGVPRCKSVYKCIYLADLTKSFQTNIYLPKSASMQPRTGLSKFAKMSKELEKTFE